MTGIKHFRTYVEGTKFIVETDHGPLTHLATLKDSHGRLARWALMLKPYQFQVRHRRASANANADGLSRDPFPYSWTVVGGVSEIFLTWIPDCLQSWGCRPASRGWPAGEVVCWCCGGGRQATESTGSGWTGWSDETQMTHELLELVREDWIYDECVYWLVVLAYCSTILPKNPSSKVLANPKRGVWLWLLRRDYT